MGPLEVCPVVNFMALELVEMHTSYPEHPVIEKKYIIVKTQYVVSKNRDNIKKQNSMSIPNFLHNCRLKFAQIVPLL